MKKQKFSILLKQSLPDFQQIPVFQLSDREKVITFFKEKMAAAMPVLNALVLAGGQSMRMGHDKTAIHWHGKEQRYYVADLLRPFANEVFISCRSAQQDNVDNDYKTIVDTFTDLGPYGAILSAFRYNPDAAWLVIASDLPLLDHTTLEHLVQHRNPASIATTFIGADGQPEPLITIWERKSYLLLLAQLAQGYSCPRKLLLNNDVHLLTAPDATALMNVNTPEQAAEAKQLLEMKLSKA
jgi:molybdenum cofactor guanylyltransferase